MIRLWAQRVLTSLAFLSWAVTAAAQNAPTLLGINNTTNTSVAVTGTILQAGSLLCATVYTNTGQSATVTDTKGNTYPSIVVAKMFAGFNWVETLYVAANNGAGAVTITATVGASTSLDLAVYEWPGQAASPLDGSNHSDQNASGTAMSSGASSGSAANAGDLVFGVTVSADTVTAGAGFTELSNYGPGGAPIEREYQTGAGNATATATQATSGQWAASVVTFKRAPSASSLSQVGVGR